MSFYNHSEISLRKRQGPVEPTATGVLTVCWAPRRGSASNCRKKKSLPRIHRTITT